MNKTELIAAVAKRAAFPGRMRKSHHRRPFHHHRVPKQGEKVQLVGFGVFETRVRPAHKATIP